MPLPWPRQKLMSVTWPAPCQPGTYFSHFQHQVQDTKSSPHCQEALLGPKHTRFWSLSALYSYKPVVSPAPVTHTFLQRRSPPLSSRTCGDCSSALHPTSEVALSSQQASSLILAYNYPAPACPRSHAGKENTAQPKHSSAQPFQWS